VVAGRWPLIAEYGGAFGKGAAKNEELNRYLPDFL
jgi:hypothetical protein